MEASKTPSSVWLPETGWPVAAGCGTPAGIDAATNSLTDKVSGLACVSNRPTPAGEGTGLAARKRTVISSVKADVGALQGSPCEATL